MILLFYLIVIGYIIYLTLGIKKLGDLRKRIITGLDKIGMVFIAIFPLGLASYLTITRFISYIEGSQYSVFQTTFYDVMDTGLYVVLFLALIYLIWRSGEIREKGLFLKPYLLKWDDINSYQIIKELSSSEVLEIITTRKNPITKKPIKINWSLEKHDAKVVKQVLDDNLG